MKHNPQPYVLPDYFYEKVANDMGLPRTVVDRVYSAYQRKLVEALKTEAHVYVKDLGTITLKPNTALAMMHKKLESAESKFQRVQTTYDIKINDYLAFISNLWLKLNQMKDTYEYIERGLEKFRSNLGRFEEFFDNDGNYKGNRKRENEDMQELSIEEGS